jgi:tetratricopeptide (TPR) repeat protein
MRTLILSLILTACIVLSGCAGRQIPAHVQSVRVLGSRGYDCFNAGNFQCAITNYQKAFLQSGSYDEPLLKADYLFNIARVYFELERYDSAVSYFSNCISEYLFYKDSAKLHTATAFHSLALALSGDMDGALKISCSDAFKRNQIDPVFNYTVNARLLQIQKKYAQASLLYDSAFVLLRKSGDVYGLSVNYYYRATIAFSQNDLPRSEALFDSAIVAMDKIPQRFRRWKILAGLSAVNFCQGEDETAMRFFYRAQECVPAGITIPDLESLKNCTYSY